MGHPPPPTPSGYRSPGRDAPPVPPGFGQARPASVSDSTELLGVLRQAVASGAHSVDSLLRSTADVARILTDAHGTALALRTNGVIVCRARSGGIAPALGAPLNAGSGISGECLRTATTLVCHDTTTDDRVDPEVCRALGVRSMVVVPLRGAVGTAGILEAFSARAYAFGDEEIDSLRALAEIAETAYMREPGGGHPVTGAATPAAVRPALFAPPEIKEETPAPKFSDEYSPQRRYWIPAVIALALVLVSAVVWFSWRGPAGEIAANEPPARPLNGSEETAGSHPLQLVPLKPDAAIARRQADRVRAKDLLRNASEIQPTADSPHPAGSADDISLLDRSGKTPARSAPATADGEPPPSVEVATSTPPEAVASMSATTEALPTLEAKVSQGITEGNLLHKVDPAYPNQARLLRIAGSVTLDATVAEDGSVREVKVVSGPPQLVAAATAAVRLWRYSPSRLSGKPIEVQRRITLVFKLP